MNCDMPWSDEVSTILQPFLSQHIQWPLSSCRGRKWLHHTFKKASSQSPCTLHCPCLNVIIIVCCFLVGFPETLVYHKRGQVPSGNNDKHIQSPEPDGWSAGRSFLVVMMVGGFIRVVLNPYQGIECGISDLSPMKMSVCILRVPTGLRLLLSSLLLKFLPAEHFKSWRYHWYHQYKIVMALRLAWLSII